MCCGQRECTLKEGFALNEGAHFGVDRFGANDQVESEFLSVRDSCIVYRVDDMRIDPFE